MSYLQQIDNKEFVKELVRRNNKGVINLNLIGCCQILYYILNVKNLLQKNFQENKDLPYDDHCFAMIDIFIPSLFTVLKKENKLCPNCLEWLGKVDDKIEKENTRKGESYWMPMGKDKDGVFEFVKTRPNEPGALKVNGLRHPTPEEIDKYMKENKIDYDEYGNK